MHNNDSPILPKSAQQLMGNNAAPEKVDDRQIVYQSEAMHQMMRMVERVAPSNATVLVMGESGTGKELIAHAIR